jgi:lycopene cyclase domain-containing protein
VTYGGFLLVFLVVPIAILGLALRRRMVRRWGWSVFGLTLVAVVYTGPWDHFIISQGVLGYPPGRVWGPTIGLVPLEEYGFFVLQVVLTSLIVLALRPAAKARGREGA